jgi:hypothetical protein
MTSAIAVTASVVLTAATAPAQPGPSADAAAGTSKLKKRISALEQRVDALARQPGPAGPQGPPGAPGVTGSAGATNVVVRTNSSGIGAGVNSSTFGLDCQPGEVATGGGVGFASPASGDRVAQSMPTSNGLISTDGQVPDGWLGAVFNGGAMRNATVWAICASP